MEQKCEAILQSEDEDEINAFIFDVLTKEVGFRYFWLFQEWPKQWISKLEEKLEDY